MRIDSTGNVGIGTSSPATELDIAKDIDAKLRITSTRNSAFVDGDNFGSLEFYGKDTSGLGEGIRAAIRAKAQGTFGVDTNLTFSTSNGSTGLDQERMRITDGGNVGIGTSSPDSLIHSFGAGNVAKFETTSFGGINLSRENAVGNNSSHFTISFTNADSEVAYFRTFNKTGATTSTGTGYELQIGTVGSGYQTFYTNASERMRIDSSGNVGIGESNPDYALVVSDSGTATLQIKAGTNTSKSRLFFADQADLARAAVEYDHNSEALSIVSNGGERMRIDSSGFVGIGVNNMSSFFNQAGKLVVGGYGNIGMTIYSSSSGNNVIAFADVADGANSGYTAGGMLLYAHGDDSMQFRTNGGERMRIDSSGNVGIGTSSPASELHIAGSGEVLRLQATDGAGTAATARMEFRDSGNSTLGFLGYISSGNSDLSIVNIANANMKFLTNDTERMRLESDGDLHVDGDVIAYSTTISDQRLKDDVQTIDNALDKVSNLRGVSYTWNNGNRKGQKDLGLIAQEVEQVLPELVREKEMPMIDGGTYKTVDYEKIVGVLIEAVKELKQEIETLKSQINI